MKKTQEALKVLLSVSNKVVKAYADDQKIDFGEAMGIALAGTKIVGVLEDLKEIKEEIKNISAEDVKALTESFKADFDIPNEDLELKIEAGVDVLIGLIAMAFAGNE